MTLQFSFFGYAIMAVIYSLSFWLLVLIWQGIRSWRGAKIIIASLGLIVLALPWVEEIWIAYHFNEACKDAGVHVVKQVEVDGYYDATGSGPIEEGYIDSSQAIAAYEKSGFRFIEYKLGYRKPGKVSRVEKQDNGKWLLTIHDRPTAQYHYRHTYNHEVVGYQLKKHERDIYDSAKNKVIGRDTAYARYPNTIEGLWIRFIGSGQLMCNHPANISKKEHTGTLVTQVLIPNY
ncbi:MAG: hypothetical protein OQL16_03175 [Gammaproteobacteria bacterium]|nr:hypothetical protein [Gammaproteobacteria bacterium]